MPFPVPLLRLYVDDTIISVPKTEVDNVLTYFNSFNTNAQFTIESENYSRGLPFLNVNQNRTPDFNHQFL